MRPIPISDELLALLGGTRHVLAAPNGDLTDDTIRPLEVATTVERDGDAVMPMHTSIWAFEPGDGDDDPTHILLTVYGAGHPPIDMQAIRIEWEAEQ